MDIMLCLLIPLALLAACAEQSVVCPDGKVVKDASECRAASPEPAGPMDDEPVVERPAEPADEEPELADEGTPTDPKVVKLISLAETKVQSMSFRHAPIEMTPGGPVPLANDVYKIRGDKAKVEVRRPQSVDPTTYVDTVYLDYAAKTAAGFCNDPRKSTCSVQGEQRRTRYEDYAIKRPLDWLGEITESARVTGSQTFNERPVSIVRYERMGQYYEAYLDQFSGVPFRVGIYTDPEYTDLVGGAEYLEFSLNMVKAEDVQLP